MTKTNSMYLGLQFHKVRVHNGGDNMAVGGRWKLEQKVEFSYLELQERSRARELERSGVFKLSKSTPSDIFQSSKFTSPKFPMQHRQQNQMFKYLSL